MWIKPQEDYQQLLRLECILHHLMSSDGVAENPDSKPVPEVTNQTT